MAQNTVILDLPYAYSVSCIPPGHSTRKSNDVMGIGPFAITSIEADEAPVSCEFDGTTYRSFEGRSYVSAGMDAVEFQERVPRCSKARYGWNDMFSSLVGSIFEGPSVPAAMPFGKPTEAAMVAQLIRSSNRGTSVRAKEDDSVDAQGRAQKVWGRNLLLVDGKPWVVLPEPRYLLELKGRQVSLRAGTIPSGASVRWSLGFRADRRDEAVAYGKAMAAKVRGHSFMDDVDPEYDIRIANAGALAFDEAVSMAASIADEMQFGFWSQAGRPDPEGGFESETFTHRRREGDASWATDFLDIPDLRKMVEFGCRRPFAEDRKEFVKGCGVVLDAWRDFFRERVLAPRDTIEDEEDLGLAMASL